MSDITRPDPDKLLEKIEQEGKFSSGRGVLKIFFGACAGVGKTYAMLSEAQQRMRDGVNVVIGIVETHGREETEKLIAGLPEIPRKVIQHRGVEIKEFDLDNALVQNPGLLILDELAHTNAPGSRHPKRWMDVEELLAHGVDVYTTLNVQHLESINDLVARTSGIQVKETVPDTVFDRAEYVSLVDIPTEELLSRLKSGRVYITEQARKNAAENFFEKRNLIALRELALRRTAERVDAQMGVETTGNNRETMLSEKIMVCVGHDSLSTRIIRHAKRLATRMKVQWFAVYVETGRHYRLGKKNQETVEHNMQLAERMGATVVFLKGDNAIDEILNFAKERGISRIIVGMRHRGWVRDFVVGTLAEKIIRKSNNIEINVITENSGKRNLGLLFPSLSSKPSGFIYATVIIALFTFGLLPLREKINANDLMMVYLICVMVVASRFGTWPSVFASLLGVGAFNFLFVEPYYTFNVHLSYQFTFLVMFIASLLIGSIASRLRLQAMFYRQKETEIRHLFSLAKVLSSTRGHENMSVAAAKYVGDILNSVVMVWFPKENNELYMVSSVDIKVDIREKSAAIWAFENGQQAGSGTDTLTATKGRYFPLMEEDIVVGVMGVIPLKEEELQPEQITTLEAFSTIIAISLHRATRSLQAEQNRIAVEAEKLRNTLLQSVSHDLRTPLVSISGLSSELLAKQGYLPQKAEEMVKTIYDQSSRLSRMVKNILDVTSLESGKIKLNKQPYFLEEIVGSAILRLKNILPEDSIDTNIKTKDLIDVDGLLIEQVFTNLLENSVKYSRNLGTLKIVITVEDKKQYLQVYVSDNGIGIDKGLEGKIFEEFRKGTQESTGLGLSICKSIVEAHGGQIWAKNREAGGAMFVFTLPKGNIETPVIEEENG